MRAAVDDQPYFPGQTLNRSKPLFGATRDTSTSESKNKCGPATAARSVTEVQASPPGIPSSSPPTIVVDTPPEPVTQKVPPIVVQSPSPLSRGAPIDEPSASCVSQDDPSLESNGVPLLPSCTDARPYGFWEQLARRANLSPPDFARKPDFPFKCLIPGMSLLADVYDSVPLVKPRWPEVEVGEQVGIEWRLGLDYNDCLADGEEPYACSTGTPSATPASKLRDQLSTLGFGSVDTTPLRRSCEGEAEADSLFEAVMFMDTDALPEPRPRSTRRAAGPVHPTIAEYGSSSPPPLMGDECRGVAFERYGEDLRCPMLDADEEVAWNLYNASGTICGDQDSPDDIRLTPEHPQSFEAHTASDRPHCSQQSGLVGGGMDIADELESVEDNNVDPDLCQQLSLLTEVQLNQKPWRFWFYSSQDDPSFGTARRHRSVDRAAWSVCRTFNYLLVEHYIKTRDRMGYNSFSPLDKARWTEEMAPIVLGQEEPCKLGLSSDPRSMLTVHMCSLKAAGTPSLLSQERDMLLDLNTPSSSDAVWRWGDPKTLSSPEAAEILVRTPTPEHERFWRASPLLSPVSDAGSLPPPARWNDTASPSEEGSILGGALNEEIQQEPAEIQDV